MELSVLGVDASHPEHAYRALPARVRSLGNHRFRSNPALEAVPLADLPKAQREGLDAAAAQRGIHSVLRSRATGRDLMVVDFDTALLFHSLVTAAACPAYLTRILGEERDRMLARLVYDGILQIEGGNGSFVDGVQAHAELFSGQEPCFITPERVGRISLGAMYYAACMRTLDARALASRLYEFNLTPRSARWQDKFATRSALAKWLGLSSPARWNRVLRSEYLGHQPGPALHPWLHWRHRGYRGQGGRHKLYVSPSVAALPAAFSNVVRICCAMGVPAFKVGCNLQGVLRPDKLVLYFSDTSSLQGVARELAVALAGVDVQGVPFTAALDSVGMLSWGMDPPSHAYVGEGDGWSWRKFIVDRIATAITRAPAANFDEVIEYALQRVRLEGIEPEGWLPITPW